ncbi:MAG: AAA family ATPase [Caldilineaceae bacterium]|nr:AAA family ATPase [Caldilineaceae bacterium]
MYEAFYGLKERPFALLPDPSFLYMSRRHGTALTLLQYSIQNRQGFTVVTGEVGCGKTTLINRLLDEVGPELRVGLINFTHSSFGEMAEWIMMAFDLDYKGKSKVELYDDFVQFLIREYAAGHPVVLIVDEAQNLGVKGLEEIRMLSNVNAQKEYLLHLILVGQPELGELLRKHELRQLMQRVSVAYNLEPFSQGDVGAYIAHRMKVAGGDPEVFTPEAVRLIAAASDGVPRLVNTLCDLCLVYGFSADQKSVDAATVRSVLRDRVRMGLSVGRQAQ